MPPKCSIKVFRGPFSLIHSVGLSTTPNTEPTTVHSRVVGPPDLDVSLIKGRVAYYPTFPKRTNVVCLLVGLFPPFSFIRQVIRGPRDLI